MDEAVLSEEAVPNQNYAERIAYLEKEIKANPRKIRISSLTILIGLYVLFFLHAYVDPYFAQSYWFPAVWLRELIGLNLNVEVALAMWGVALFVFGLIFLLYAVKHGKSLEKEFATMATPEDWLKKPENT